MCGALFVFWFVSVIVWNWSIIHDQNSKSKGHGIPNYKIVILERLQPAVFIHGLLWAASVIIHALA